MNRGERMNPQTNKSPVRVKKYSFNWCEVLSETMIESNILLLISENYNYRYPNPT